MIKPFFIVSFHLLCFIAACQDTIKNYPNQLKLSVSRAVNFLNPGVEISFEKKVFDHFSIQLTAGIPASLTGKPFEKLKGFNISMEGKSFLTKNTHSGRYISLLLDHSNLRYEEQTSGMDPGTSQTIVDSFTISRKKISLTFHYGLQFYKKHFVVDINLGAGIKYRAVKHYGRVLEYKGPREFFDLHRAANMEKKGMTIHLPFNIQFGYIF